MIRTTDWKLNTYDQEPGELFDLKNDPEEFFNLVNDPAHADRVTELNQRLTQWRESC